ncbi:hypothetical protein [Moraxella catarrhalis]|uniref:hypothetical protein n=1 Tax=Moraxella catarrhalis TaxID=480 RepID=UPI0013CF5277|nr:hypothetical protein [Moraxella catarrhalis]
MMYSPNKTAQIKLPDDKRLLVTDCTIKHIEELFKFFITKPNEITSFYEYLYLPTQPTVIMGL